ncbi:uncharacterized protein I206_101414 [Kwoniella pini CBS 10737]|uniref:Association with the SNF1 complex (ASC) domain-containing protein n=1 Tax=Kwoniella pini CBS 10737 TaxID=1296096 RepID=A0A1B9HWS7_9TREE|nr:uncharacterized protein I206_06616 [Kwoniella pini CBS 10737]OCF47710.1 hypothetical protein I206_06616 [Kwoniella pini CBS 10737]
MGNTPSSHQHGQASPHHSQRQDEESSSSSSHHHHHHRHPNLRLPMPQRPTHISPQSSNPTSPSGGRSGSPRRRKSLELPDLNKLSFTPSALTPAAPVPTVHTHTSHHLAPSTSAITSNKTSPINTSDPPIPPSNIVPTKRWQHALGGRASPLTNPNALGAMSKLDNNVPSKSAPISMPNTNIQHRGDESNPYFPTTAAQEAAAKSIPIPIPGKELPPPLGKPAGLSPPPPTKAPTPLPPNASATQQGEQSTPLQPVDDGLVNVPVHWTGGGKTVYVTGNFADNWKGRIKLHRSTHDFNTTLRLPPGQYRLKFIVDDSWRCSKQISTAVDDDGTLVNWIEVETPKTEEEMRAEWAMDAKPAVKEENVDESAWTTTIPPALTLWQYVEELPTHFSPEEYQSFMKTIPYLPAVPPPPILPRILDKVIVNNDSKRLWDSHDPSMAQQTGYSAPATLDDNSILAVPNHVVLNHLTASAIRNGTLGVGTTTRYRKKYITTMFFKPTLADMPGTQPVTESVSQVPSESISQAQSVQ